MKKRLLITNGLIASIVMVGYFAHWDRFFAEEYLEVASPNESHYLVVERVQMFFSMPGGGSDARGFVSLYNESDELLKRVRIPMVQLAEAEWTTDSVSFWRIEWSLK